MNKKEETIYKVLDLVISECSITEVGEMSREDAIIEDALTWCFFDEDAPDGKLWRYLHAML